VATTTPPCGRRARASCAPGPIVVLVLDEGTETDPERWTHAVPLAGASETRTLVVSPRGRRAPATSGRGLGSAYRVARDRERLVVTVARAG
jgi:hypothetical protein